MRDFQEKRSRIVSMANEKMLCTRIMFVRRAGRLSTAEIGTSSLRATYFGRPYEGDMVSNSSLIAYSTRRGVISDIRAALSPKQLTTKSD